MFHFFQNVEILIAASVSNCDSEIPQIAAAFGSFNGRMLEALVELGG